jgi:hypothetical protein
MITLEAAISHDQNGDIIHKGETVLVPEDVFNEGIINSHDFDVLQPDQKIEVEVIDSLSEERVSVIRPSDGAITVIDARYTQKKPKVVEAPVYFEGQPLATENESADMGRARLMAPVDDVINQTAEILLKSMKAVRRTVMPQSYSIQKISQTKVAETGKVLEGVVVSQIKVSDLFQKRKMAVTVEMKIMGGQVQEPFGFRTSAGKMYVFNPNGFVKAMKIPASPYLGKKPGSAVLSFLPDH